MTAAVVHLVGILLLVFITAVQAGTFTAVHLDLSGRQVPEPAPKPRRWAAVATIATIATVAGLLLPTVAVVALTPSQGPQLSLQRNVFDGWAEEIVWNRGQRPVVFTQSGAYGCDDDRCRSGQELSFSGFFHETLAVGVAADGARLSVRMSRDSDDYLSLQRCADDCAYFGSLRLPTRDGTDALPQYGIAGAPDGTIWVAIAQQRTRQAGLELSLIRCGQVRCDNEPHRVVAGTVDGDLPGEWIPRTVHMRFEPDGRTVASFDRGYGPVHVVTCETLACTSASISVRPDAHLTFRPTADPRETLATGSHGYFYAGHEKVRDPSPVRIDLGKQPPRHERIVLWHCPDPSCLQLRRIPLHVTEVPSDAVQAPGVRLAVGPDGTILVAEGTNLITLHP